MLCACGAGEGLPDAVVAGNLGSIGGGGELRVGTQEGSDLFGLHLVHAERVGLESGVCGFKSALTWSQVRVS